VFLNICIEGIQPWEGKAHGELTAEGKKLQEGEQIFAERNTAGTHGPGAETMEDFRREVNFVGERNFKESRKMK